jgi:hypothetical protein
MLRIKRPVIHLNGCVAFLFFHLDVYKQARAFAIEAENLSQRFKVDDPATADQLRRASGDALLSIAEGYG